LSGFEQKILSARLLRSWNQRPPPCLGSDRLPGPQHIEEERRMNKLLLVIIAFLLPPLAVGLKAGIGNQLFLNIILTLLVYVPGLFHALWVVLKD
jgi:uncharacterized membrane protein YqaE (UPF0057 family)